MTRPMVRLAEPRMYSVKEAAAFCCMSRTWIRSRIAAGDFDAFLCGNLLISGQSINRYLASRAIGSASVERAAAVETPPTVE